MRVLLIVLFFSFLSGCEAMNLEELLSFEKAPYQSPLARNLFVDNSFTYEAIREGKIAFINLNFTVPRQGRGIDIDDEIGVDLPPYTYRFHEFLQKERVDIPWVGPVTVYSKMGRDEYLTMHSGFNDKTFKNWINAWKQNKSIARYIATAEKFEDEYEFAERRDGYTYDDRTMTIKLDIFDTKTSQRVWSGVISHTTQERRDRNDEMWLYSIIAGDLANNMPTADALMPLNND